MKDECRYCAHCDYAISRDEIKLFKFDLPCPRCAKVPVSNFYSFNSVYHVRVRWERWRKGEVKGSPPCPSKEAIKKRGLFEEIDAVVEDAYNRRTAQNAEPTQ